MKKVEAIIRGGDFERVKGALKQIGIVPLTAILFRDGVCREAFLLTTFYLR